MINTGGVPSWILVMSNVGSAHAVVNTSIQRSGGQREFPSTLFGPDDDFDPM